MKIVPRSLAGRTLLVLLAGLAVSNLVGLLIFAGERGTALTGVAAETVAERIVAVVQTLEQTPPAAREGVLCSQQGPGLAAGLAPETVVQAGAGDRRSRRMRAAIRDLLDDPAANRLRVAGGGGDRRFGQVIGAVMARCGGAVMPMMRMMSRGMAGHDMAAMMGMMGHAGPTVTVSYRLADGAWLNVVARAPLVDPIWRSRFFLAFAVMAIVVTVLSVWAVRRATAPLGLLGRAAVRLGRDVNAPDLPEDGPLEVRRAATAFNDMKRRLRDLIRDRTQMLAAITHDLRTPITRLRLRAEFVEDAEQRARMLGDLDQMEAMITATLAFVRGDSADEARQVLDLAGLVQSVADDAADLGRDVVYDGPARAAFSGRPLALRRAFANLVDNAVKYGDRARVTLEAAPARFVITVADQGPGIPEAEIERVFEPFHRVETSRSRETGGTGLGLAVVRSILRGHGGDVTLANRAEGGLCATVTLPRA